MARSRDISISEAGILAPPPLLLVVLLMLLVVVVLVPFSALLRLLLVLPVMADLSAVRHTGHVACWQQPTNYKNNGLDRGRIDRIRLTYDPELQSPAMGGHTAFILR